MRARIDTCDRQHRDPQKADGWQLFGRQHSHCTRCSEVHRKLVLTRQCVLCFVRVGPVGAVSRLRQAHSPSDSISCIPRYYCLWALGQGEKWFSHVVGVRGQHMSGRYSLPAIPCGKSTAQQNQSGPGHTCESEHSGSVDAQLNSCGTTRPGFQRDMSRRNASARCSADVGGAGRSGQCPPSSPGPHVVDAPSSAATPVKGSIMIGSSSRLTNKEQQNQLARDGDGACTAGLISRRRSGSLKRIS